MVEELINNSSFKFVNIPISVSNHHLHLTQEAVELLFGRDYKLRKRKDLSQPGQYACEETVDVVTPKGKMSCRIVGPCRDKIQVELSKTDSVILGIDPPVRLSGNLKGSAPIKLTGPKGELNLEEGVIISARHIHLSDEEGNKFKLKHGDLVNLAVKSNRGYHVLGNLICRVGRDHKLDVHIDTDEANAIGINNGDIGYIFYKN